jgi:aldose 1-epimerase
MASFSVFSRRAIVLSASLVFLPCLTMSHADDSTNPLPTPTTGVTSRPFGETAQKQLVTLHTLTNKNGMSVSIMDYGATVVSIVVPDRAGHLTDVALGFDRFTPYLHQDAFFGATIGRYANRIAHGRFSLDHITYQLPINNGLNTLHGGTRGFDQRVWKEEAVDSDVPAIRFSLLSADGDQGFPGNLFVAVTFTLNDDNELRISYQATTDKPTVINLTNHTYFNLAGAGSGTILDHVLILHAESFLPTNAELIPTGEIKSVEGTPWDFTNPTAMGLHLKEAGGKPVGYDQTYVLKKGFFSDTALAAEVEEPQSGRTLKVTTDQPGVQFYTGNFLNGSLTGKDGKVYRQYSGFCLETQHYPDSPNEPAFPSTVLLPGDTFRSSTTYAFGVK